ncbi:MAG TPA: crotonase/enoyl-CoA hydratase family protein [Burkholderiales bacterium]|nr:crotonase/enoyl-CoA hydratase family protein [Burkholderiales bacterium]
MNTTELSSLRAFDPSSSTQYQMEFDAESATLWSFLNPLGNPCFSPSLLHDIRAQDSLLEQQKGFVLHEGRPRRAHYYVIASRVSGVFNLGGDLALFQALIRMKDRPTLFNYARACVDCIYPRVRNHFIKELTTISLVQGDALGGGFETALASDVIIAEEQATMGLPEILFNLFPGMGAYSLLARRIGMRPAEEMILSGRLFKAPELLGMGVIDLVVPKGAGVQATNQWIAQNRKRRVGMNAIHAARQEIHPITREEMDRIVEIWVDAAMNLEERDLKMMKRLVAAQGRRTGLMEHDVVKAFGASEAA